MLWLDANDVVTPDAQAAMRTAKREILTDNLDASTSLYRYLFTAEADECTVSFHRERFASRVPELRLAGAVHEVLMVPRSRVLHREDLSIEHRPDPTKRESKSSRNLRIAEHAVQTGDRSPRTLHDYSCKLRDAGRDTDALEMCEAQLQDPGMMEWEQYAALISMSEYSERLGQPGDAVKHLHTAARLDPSRAEAFLRIGWRYFKREEREKALPFYLPQPGQVRQIWGPSPP